MALCYRYAIAQLRANPLRDEKLNLGIVVFEDSTLRVYPARNLDKVRAISAALDVAIIEQSLGQLPDLDQHVREEGVLAPLERIDALAAFSPIAFSSIGEFYAPTADAYDAAVKRLLFQLVEPEPAPRRAAREKRTRLLTSIKLAFRSEKILAKKGEGIDSHRVLVNRELAEGLNADLLLKNGAMHVVQTVDASNVDRARKAIQEIGVSVLVFEQAKIEFGDSDTVRRLVYSSNVQLENSISPALHAAEHQGVRLINWESRDDRTKFIVEMSSLAEPADTQKKALFGRIHASAQDRNKLN